MTERVKERKGEREGRERERGERDRVDRDRLEREMKADKERKYMEDRWT